MPATVVTSYQLPQSAASGSAAADARETFVYVVVLSEPDGTDGARTARDAAGIPAINDTLGSTGLKVIRKRAEAESGDDSGLNYRVTVEYGVDAVGSTGSSGEPWTRKDRIRRSVQNYQIYKSSDLLGAPIVNKAGDPLAGGLAFDEYNPVRIVNRFRRFTDFDPEVAEACVGSINEASFTLNPQRGVLTVPAKRALLRNITCNDAIWPATGTFYYDITLDLEIEVGVPLQFYFATNKGYYYIDTDDGNTKKAFVKLSPSVGGKTVPVAGETLLRTDGNIATSGQYVGYVHDLTNNSSYDPGYDLKFTRHIVKSWAAWI